MPLGDVAQVDDEHGQAVGAPGDPIGRRRAREQQQEVAVQRPRRPALVAGDEVAVAVADRLGADLRRVGSDLALGDAERLHTDLARGDAGQVAALLVLAAVAQHGAHHVHLRVARRGAAARAVDLLEDHARRGQPEAGAAVLRRDQRAEVSRARHRLDVLGGVAVGLEAAPVLVREAGAQGPDLGPQLLELGGRLEARGCGDVAAHRAPAVWQPPRTVGA